jgi:hypothetical protein
LPTTSGYESGLAESTRYKMLGSPLVAELVAVIIQAVMSTSTEAKASNTPTTGTDRPFFVDAGAEAPTVAGFLLILARSNFSFSPTAQILKSHRAMEHEIRQFVTTTTTIYFLEIPLGARFC